MNHKQIKELIRHTLKKLGMWSEQAEELVFLTGLVESGYRYISQIGSGIARSFWQVESATAKDSIDFDNANQIVYLYGEAKVEYDKISLEADFIKVYIGKNEVHAFSKKDSTGEVIEKVLFTDDGESFTATGMAYNFTSKKGRIIQTTTQQGEMYLLSEKGKKMANDDIFLKRGKITTCDAEHPHFYFEATKLKIVPGKKIVVGPTNLIIRELRTPLVIPFGMFPNNQKNQSGILIPGYASGGLGYGLDQLGFHWAINDYVHAEIMSDIYFSGTYRLSSEIKYKK